MKNLFIYFSFLGIFWGSFSAKAQKQTAWDSLKREYAFFLQAQGEIFINEVPVKMVIVSKSGKYGLIDSKGRVLLPFRYEHIHDTPNMLIFTEKKRKGFLLKQREFTHVDCLYEQIILPPSQTTYAYAFIQQKGKWGAINSEGEFFIQTEYDSLQIGSDLGGDGGVFLAKKGGKWGCMGSSTEIYLPFLYDELQIMDGNCIARKNGKFGLLNLNKGALIPFEYDRLLPYQQSIGTCFLALQNQQWGLLSDVQGAEPLLPFIHQLKTQFLEGAPPVYHLARNGKWGIYGLPNAEMLAPFEYDSIGLYRTVLKNGKWGWYNLDGELKIPCEYDSIRFLDSDLNADLVYFQVAKSNKLGLVNTAGETLIKCLYDKIEQIQITNPNAEFATPIFKNWLISQDNKYGLLDFSGDSLLIPLQYDSILLYPPTEASLNYQHFYYFAYQKGKISLYLQNAEQSCVRVLENVDKIQSESLHFDNSMPEFLFKKASKQGYLNTLTGILLNAGYDSLTQTNNGDFIVQKNEKFGLLREFLEENMDSFRIRPIYDSLIENTTSNYAFFIAYAGEKWGILNQNGDTIHRFQYEAQPLEYWDGHICKKNGKYALLTKSPYPTSALFRVDTNQQTPDAWFEYDSLSFTSHESPFLWVKKQSKWGVLRITGTVIVPTDYDELSPLPIENWILAKKAGKYGVLVYDEASEQLLVQIPISYDSLIWDDSGYLFAQKNQRWGTIDTSNRILTPLEYENLQIPPNFRPCLVKNGRFFPIAANGRSKLTQGITSYLNQILPTMENTAPQPFEPTEQNQYYYFWSYYPIYKVVKNGSKFGVYSYQTDTLCLPAQYDSIAYAGTGCTEKHYFYILKKGKWGLVDAENRLVLKPKYAHIGAFNLLEQQFLVQKKARQKNYELINLLKKPSKKAKYNPILYNNCLN